MRQSARKKVALPAPSRTDLIAAGTPGGLFAPMLVTCALCVRTVFITLDIEYPRAGLMRVDAFDHARVELRRSVK